MTTVLFCDKQKPRGSGDGLWQNASLVHDALSWMKTCCCHCNIRVIRPHWVFFTYRATQFIQSPVVSRQSSNFSTGMLRKGSVAVAHCPIHWIGARKQFLLTKKSLSYFHFTNSSHRSGVADFLFLNVCLALKYGFVKLSLTWLLIKYFCRRLSLFMMKLII